MRSPQPFFSSRRSVTRHRCKDSKRRFVMTRVLLLLLLLLLLSIAYRRVEGYLRPPQAVLVLGGSPEREVFAAIFAREHPDLPIWVSSGTPRDYAEWVFSQAGVPRDRLHLDYSAVDTVTNFTTLVDGFQAQGIRSVYLITSDYHMRRAQVIGEIILGSRDIAFKPISVPSERSPESFDKTLRDGARAILWVTTGHTGSSMKQFFNEGS